MFRVLKRTIGVCLVGLGLGVVLVLLLPLTCWLFITGIAILILGLIWLFGK